MKEIIQEYKKDMMVTLTIEDLGSDGEGIGKLNGYPFFVKDALPGDVIEAKVMKAKKNYAYARLIKILEPSKDRIQSPCGCHKQCGGCQIQALSYEAQLTYKENKVKNHLLRIGGFLEQEIKQVMNPIIGMEEPFHYRNKAQFPFGLDKAGRIVTGFYAGRTHSIIPNTDCILGVSENQVILEHILDYMNTEQIKPYQEETHQGLIRHALIRKGFATGELMVCLVINGGSLPKQEKLLERLQTVPGMTSISYSINREKTNVIMGNTIKTIWGSESIHDFIGAVEFKISPLSFYQVNPVQTEKLYSLALEYANLSGQETVWDLYCGIGTISLFLAQKAKQVYGVEIVPQAIEDAKENAKINHITNAEFYVGKAEEVLPEQYEKHGVYADVIVVDPPRKGCDEVTLQTMLTMKPKRIVYVSCDSATLARDLRILCDGGYEIFVK
jgi:23S rRNA (uracil1939-C5)-methyltransferase